MDPSDVLAECLAHSVMNDSVYGSSSQQQPMVYDAACVLRMFDYFWSNARFSALANTLFSVVYATLAVLALLANVTVLCTIVRSQRGWAASTARKASVGGGTRNAVRLNVFIANMATSNLILSLCLVPLLWLPSMTYHFAYGNVACKAANALPAINIYCSAITLAVMAVDRYDNVSHGSRVRSGWHLLLSVLAIWLAAVLLSVPLIVAYSVNRIPLLNQSIVVHPSDGTARNYYMDMCRMTNSDALRYSVMFLQVLFLYVMPLTVILYYNHKLVTFLRTTKKALRSHSTYLGNQRLAHEPGVQSPSFFTLLLPPSIRASVSSRHDTQQQQQQQQQQTGPASAVYRNRRATRLLGTMAVSYALLWLPFTLLTLLDDLGLSTDRVFLLPWPVVDELGKLVSLLSLCVINPYIYGFLNTNLQQEFVRLWHKYRPSASTNCLPSANVNRCKAANQQLLLRPYSSAKTKSSCTVMDHLRVDDGDGLDGLRRSVSTPCAPGAVARKQGTSAQQTTPVAAGSTLLLNGGCSVVINEDAL